MEKVVVRQLFRDISRYLNQSVEINGWIRSNRDQKSFGFIVLNDGTHFNSVQVVYEKEALSNFAEVARYRAGAAITVRGVVVATPRPNSPGRSKPRK